MMRGMFAAISGLKNHQVMLDVTSNDIANVNTIGYKSARTTFQDSLTQLQRGASGASGANGGTNAAQVGLGVGLGSIDNLMQGGSLQSTGNVFDVAITGPGFFRVSTSTATPPTPGTNMASANEKIAGSLTSSNAIGLIGRTVTYVDGSDQIHTGTVEKVTTTDGKPSLTVAGIDGVDPSTITQVA